MPVRRRQREQWHQLAETSGASTSKRTAPQRQPPVGSRAWSAATASPRRSAAQARPFRAVSRGLAPRVQAWLNNCRRHAPIRLDQRRPSEPGRGDVAFRACLVPVPRTRSQGTVAARRDLRPRRQLARAADRGVEQLDRMRGRDRPAGAAQRRRHLEQAARVRARVDLRLGGEHVRGLAVAERRAPRRAGRGCRSRRCRSTAPARPARRARAPGSSAASRAARRARAARGRGGTPPGRRRAAAARASSGARARGDQPPRCRRTGRSSPASFRCEPQPAAFVTIVSAPAARNAAAVRRACASPSCRRPACSASAPQHSRVRRRHLVAVGREHARRGAVDLAEDHALHAAGQQPDPREPLAARGRLDRRRDRLAPRRRERLQRPERARRRQPRERAAPPQPRRMREHGEHDPPQQPLATAAAAPAPRPARARARSACRTSRRTGTR